MSESPAYVLLGDVLDGVPDRPWIQREVGALLGIDPDSPDIDACRIYPPENAPSE